MMELNNSESNISREQRQERIAEYVLQNSPARVQELAELFGVSLMTIYRDLEDLENQGILRRVRGGATAQPSSLFESDIRYRLTKMTREKEAIARLALTYVEPGQAIMMDDSTTTLALARLLPTLSHVTVITNCLSIIRELSTVRSIRLIAVGGEYMPRYDAFTGVICEQVIASLRANVLFMSTSAVSDLIAFHQEQEIVKVKRAMMASASRRILLLDHSKLGTIALHKLANLDDFDLVIIDSGISEAQLKELQDAHIPVHIAPI